MRRNGTLILSLPPGSWKASRTPSTSAYAPATLPPTSRRSRDHGNRSTLADLAVPSRRPRVVVTFDDGYRDKLTTAQPIAQSKGVPITVFVTSGILGTTTVSGGTASEHCCARGHRT